MTARAWWQIALGALLLVAGMVGLWFLGPARWLDAVERVERRAPPRGEGVHRPPELPPSLIGRQVDAATTDVKPPGPGLVVQFVIEGTDTPIPYVDWYVRGGTRRVKRYVRGELAYVDERVVLFEEVADGEGRARIPAEAASAWREHDLLARRGLFEPVEVTDPPVEKDGVVTIEMPPRRTGATPVVFRRYVGFVMDRWRCVISHALLRFGDGSREWRARTDEKGYFDLHVPVTPGDDDWPLVAVAPRYEAVEVWLPIEGGDNQEIVLEEDPSTVSLTVRVLTSEGRAAAGAWVHVLWTSSDTGMLEPRDALEYWFPAMGEADESGCFVVHGVPAGEVRVRSCQGGEVAERSVVIEAPAADPEIRLQPGRVLRGTLRELRPCGCGSGHQVELSFVAKPSATHSFWPPLRTRTALGREASTDYEIRGAPLGRLFLRVRTCCHAREHIEVPASETPETVDLDEIVLVPDR